jgi:hypothetical protein
MPGLRDSGAMEKQGLLLAAAVVKRYGREAWPPVFAS